MIILVNGRPAPQGSKDVGKYGQVIEQSPYLRAWRAAVREGAFRAYRDLNLPMSALPLFGAGPVYLHRVTFCLAADQCRTDGTDAPTGTPDLDKLLRATLDALGGALSGTGRLFKDDSQVVSIGNLQKIRGGASPGAVIVASDEPMEKDDTYGTV